MWWLWSMLLLVYKIHINVTCELFKLKYYKMFNCRVINQMPSNILNAQMFMITQNIFACFIIQITFFILKLALLRTYFLSGRCKLISSVLCMPMEKVNLLTMLSHQSQLNHHISFTSKQPASQLSSWGSTRSAWLSHKFPKTKQFAESWPLCSYQRAG